jgi:hypothetical protein
MLGDESMRRVIAKEAFGKAVIKEQSFTTNTHT